MLVARSGVGLVALVLAAAACLPEGTGARPPAIEPSPVLSPRSSPFVSIEDLPKPRFHGTVANIDEATRARMTASWRPGCPLPLEDLRLLTLSYWGFDGEVRTGELVVHGDEARPVLRVFLRLFRARFPIKRMRLVDVYGGDDNRSMAANNTSGFNCRPSAANPDVWSEHSYGRAIDINPVQNPYVDGGTVLPPAGAAYLDRSRTARGMIHPGDVVVRAFAAIGWSWGGDYQSLKDYQHFSATGR